MEGRYIYNFSTQERIDCLSKNEEELSELEKVKKELEFYKSLFKSHHNSVVFNLSIKKKNGKNVWVDHINDKREYIETLDKDEEVISWLVPVKPSR